MSFGFRKLPEDVTLNDLGQRVFDVLARHTSFPWPVLQAQCKRHGVDPRTLAPEGLTRVVDDLADAVGRFTSPQTKQAVASELRSLV